MKVIKKGILDTFQDGGRKNLAHTGVSMGGNMDNLSAMLANIIAGNNRQNPVLEMHFPAPVLSFSLGVFICLSGADFDAACGERKIRLNRLYFLPAGSTLHFHKKISGQRCYLAIRGGWSLEKVLGGYGTHLLSGFGGWKGRALKKNDEIPYKTAKEEHNPSGYDWYIDPTIYFHKQPVRFLPGPEWDILTEESKVIIEKEPFRIDQKNDRMAYRLNGPGLTGNKSFEMLSSGVIHGTLQLLPNGQTILLMADAQTTGGYPRLLQIISTDLPRVAQMGTGETVQFKMVTMEFAQNLLTVQEEWLDSIEKSVRLKTLFSEKQ